MLKSIGARDKKDKIDYFEIVRKSPRTGKTLTTQDLKTQIVELRAEKLKKAS